TVMRRVLDLVGQDRLHQIGIRSCTREEHELSSMLSTTPEKVSLLAGENPCYLTCDIDILDPSVLPGTGTPDPGGLSFRELSNLLVSMITRLRVVGMDIVELSPGLDPSGVSAVVAAKLVRESLLALHRAPACG
ncbi:MAG TPA: arginase family protein, partial [Deltaproteobacteria bacterium]|nr:arginase family protein [Deltaproteobacteria bacterium]